MGPMRFSQPISICSDLFRLIQIMHVTHYSLYAQKSSDTIWRFMHLQACVPSPSVVHSCDSNQTIELSANHLIVFISQMSHKSISNFPLWMKMVSANCLYLLDRWQFTQNYPTNKSIKCHKMIKNTSTICQANFNLEKRYFCTNSNCFKQHETTNYSYCGNKLILNIYRKRQMVWVN